MDSFVVLQVGGRPKRLAAVLALVVLLPRVDAAVYHEAVLAFEILAAELTLVLPGVGKQRVMR